MNIEYAQSEQEVISRVSQGCVPGPVLYQPYSCDIPQLENITIVTFKDVTIIIAVGNKNI